MLFPPPIRDLLVKENGFSKLSRAPARGIDRELHCSQNAQRQALGGDDVQRVEHVVWRSQFSDTARVFDQSRLKIGKIRDGCGAVQ